MNKFHSAALSAALFLLAAAALATSPAASAQSRYVNYRYAPEWFETTTAFPDDSYKTLVAPQGQLLYEYHNGGDGFFNFVNSFGTVIHMMADENQKFEKTSLLSAKNPTVLVKSSMLLGDVEQKIYSTSPKIGCDREDVILTTFRNTSSKEAELHPVVIVNTWHKVTVEGRTVTIDSLGHFVMSLPAVRVRHNLEDFKTVIELEGVKVPAKADCQIVGIFDNGLSSSLCDALATEPEKTVAGMDSNCQKVQDYWENGSPMPYGHVLVPDPEIQNLFDASIRGIWQAREIKDGSICLQVGPTCYRGLWIVDGTFLSEASAMVGCGKDARSGIEYTLSFQKESGEFDMLNPTFYKEHGLILMTCVRHAMLTQDKEWLSSKWAALSKTMDFIHVLRERSYLDDIHEDDGLIPPGFIDGGLVGGTDVPEYSNTLWCLSGMKAMLSAAKWLGKDEDLKRWQKEYDDFYSIFHKAALRDLDVDDFGHHYLNNMMKREQRDIPQRGQWTFCQSIYPGQIFTSDDPIATGTMDMLGETLQEGCVMGTGWIKEGIWNYFSSFYGHALLWTGQGEKAANVLYAFANHASPVYLWREEHNPRDLRSSYVGDMPHNWASAEFIRLTTHLLELDRGDELHLLEGIPEEWVEAGKHTELKEVATPFGPISFRLDVDKKGRTATMSIDPLKDNCKAIVLHTGTWGTVDGKNLITLDPLKSNTVRISL